MQLDGWEAIFFYALAFLALFFAVFTISARNAVHSALFLMSTLVCAAGLFLLVQAEFLAGVQILVYVGGVLVLFLFVIMLVNVREENVQIYTRQFTIGMFIVSLLAFGIVVVLLETQSANYFRVPEGKTAEQTLQDIEERVKGLPPDVAAQVRARAEAEARAQAGSANVPATLSENTQKVGTELYTRAALPFEIASILLLVAIIGAVRLARERKQEQLYD